MSADSRVLVTNARLRKSLATIRSLGRHGIRITAAEQSRMALSFFSRYTEKVVVYPDPKTRPDDFLHWLISFLRAEPHDVLFPMDDDVLEVVTQHLPELRRYVIVPVVDRQTYMIASDKHRTIQFAQSAGVPCPKTLVASSLEEIKKLAPAVAYPLVIKPRSSSGSRGLVYVSNPGELIQAWGEVHRRFPEPLIQEYIPAGGQAFGVSTLLDQNSQPLAVFVHRRLREYPVSGGPSTLCESVQHDYLANVSVRLLQQLKWVGIAMVEFKTDPRDGFPRLMEINPRFWGSLQLAIYCGIDFPWLLYQLATGKKIVPIDRYPTGKRYRWLPGDILHFLENADRWKIARDFFRFDRPRTCYDVPSLEDWWPLVGLVLTLGREALWSITKSVPMRLSFRKSRI